MRPMSGRGGPSAQRWMVCALAALGHLGVLLVLSHGLHFRESTSADWSMEVVSIEMPKPPEVSAKPPDPKRKYPALAHQPRSERPALSLPPPSSSAPQADDQPRNASIDWDAQAHDATDATLKRAQEAAGRRSFVHEFAAPATPEKPGIFGSEQENHRAGRVEGGGTVFWVTDNCYFEIPRGPPPMRMAGEFHLLTPTCKPPPTGGGEQLFKDLTPESLRKLPAPPAAK